MIKNLFAATALGLLALTGAAVAQTAPQAAPAAPAAAATPTSPEDCLKAAFDLAQIAEDKKLPDAQLNAIEGLLTQMESHCDAKQFTEAAAVGSNLKSMIEKQ
jgi:hypothetical protein